MFVRRTRVLILFVLFQLNEQQFTWIEALKSRSNNNNNHEYKLNTAKRNTHSTQYTNNKTDTFTLTVIETQIYDGANWTLCDYKDAATGELYEQEELQQHDWTIAQSQSQDDEWTYSLRSRPTRKRTWTRQPTVALVRVRDQENDEDEEDDDTRRLVAFATSQKRKQHRRRKQSSQLVFFQRQCTAFNNWIKDHYNFKGFGCTLYKSLIWKRACGVALRLPLTANWNAWDQRPALPNVSVNVAVYYPNPRAVLFLNASVRMEWLQWFLSTSVATLMYMVGWMLYTFLVRGLLMVGSALAFPITHTWYAPRFPMEHPHWNGPDSYSRRAEERVGVSWSWIFEMHPLMSASCPMTRRVTLFHYYAMALPNWSVVPDWLVRHVAAAGTSISGPIPEMPYVAASALLSLSGFHYQDAIAHWWYHRHCRRTNNNKQDAIQQVEDNDDSNSEQDDLEEYEPQEQPAKRTGDNANVASRAYKRKLLVDLEE
jgi:hypothetical protein